MRLIFEIFKNRQYSHTVNTTSASEVISTVHTDIFTVYTAKNFPGVVGKYILYYYLKLNAWSKYANMSVNFLLESTPLTQCFSRQGIKIPFRRDIGKMNIQKKDSSQKDVE